MTCSGNETVLLLMLEKSRRDRFDEVLRTLEQMGGVIVSRVPEAGLMAVRIGPALIDDVKAIDGVAFVELSRTLKV